MASRDQDFARLVAEHRHALMRYGLRRLDDVASAEDLVAESFLVAWRNWNDLPPRDEELFWLYGIARRVIANMHRSELRQASLYARLSLERTQGADSPRFAKEDIDRLLSAMSSLSDSDRETLRLKYWEGLSYRQIGQVLDCSENSIGLRLSRIKESIRDRFVEPASPVEARRRDEK